ncbi:putative permease [compost metagenome]
MEIFQWLNDQLLRMDWLAHLVRLLVEDGLGLDMASRVGASVHFFIYDVIKIFILLSVLIFAISWVQSYFPPERTRRILGGLQGFRANVMGALLGTVTPFCSCSSIPLFIGFTSSGLPLAVTFSFLISSPLVDLASVILLASIFNWSIAIAYVLIGIVLAVLGGTLIGRARMERHVAEFVRNAPQLDIEQAQPTRRERLAFCAGQVGEIIQRVWLYILIGVGIGAAIHNWIPAELIGALLGEDRWWSVPLAALVGVPMYADIFGTLPIAEALVAKGVGLGTALAFMMAVTALSLPSLIMLRKVVAPPLLALFFAIVLVGIVLIGYLFNSFAYLFI